METYVGSVRHDSSSFFECRERSSELKREAKGRGGGKRGRCAQLFSLGSRLGHVEGKLRVRDLHIDRATRQ